MRRYIGAFFIAISWINLMVGLIQFGLTAYGQPGGTLLKAAFHGLVSIFTFLFALLFLAEELSK